MSKRFADHTNKSVTSDSRSKFESSPSNFEIRGPTESVECHENNDHFALLYEDQTEQFDTVVPFIREGLQRGERCVYVADDNTVDEVLDAMRARGVDVESALESGALSVHTEDETYRRTGEFDREAMLEFWEEALEDATANEFTGVRAAAEMMWALEADETSLDDLCEYEELLNPLYDGEDYSVLCQYNRDRFPADILHDVLKTHPFLVYDDTTVCQNFYYTPPDEYFGPDQPSRELDRKLATLVARTDVQATLETRERYQRDLYETIATPNTSLGEKIEELLELGRERLNLEIGYFTKTLDDNTFEIVEAVGNHESLQPGVTDSFRDTYCEKLLGSSGPVSVQDAADVGWTDDPAYERFGLEAYFATTVHVGGNEYGTLCFASETPREDPYTDAERTFLDLMGQWVEYELERQQREAFLRECYKITSDPDLSFEAKLDQLLSLGQEQFGLDVGGIAKIDPATDHFEVEIVRGDHDHLVPGAQYPLSETYCQLVTEDGETAGVTDPVAAGFEDKLCYERFGVQAYLGTHLEIDGDMDRTFWFLSTEPRESPITDEESTFIDLMGQWVEYELERRQRERELERTKTRFKTVFEQTNDGVFLIDHEADAFVDANAAAAEMLGYSRDELTSLRPSDVHPDDAEQFHAFLEEVRETGSAWSEDLYCRTKDGRDLPAEVSASAVTLDGCDLVLANVRPIEERKQHERYQRDLYDIIADTGASFDAKIERLLELGRERFGLENGYFNRIDTEAYEFEVVEAVGSHDMIEPGAVDSLSGTFCETHLDSPDPLGVADVVDAGMDDLRAHNQYDLDAYFAATVHVGSDEYGTLCFASETPRDKLFTKAERTFLDLMAQCVSYELERDHREAQLEQKNERLESFASLLAHELRNPVTIGQIYSQQLPEETDAEAVEYITEAFDRIEDMVDVLLILTRGRDAVGERTPVDLPTVAREAWDTVNTPVATLDIELDDTIQADETYIRHLFRNLIENAVEHGGSDVTVTVGALEDGFYVADDGTGILPEERETVFDEGYTTAADNGGTGLGLAFVQKLADVYEWDCTVTESEAGGARFEFQNVFDQ